MRTAILLPALLLLGSSALLVQSRELLATADCSDDIPHCQSGHCSVRTLGGTQVTHCRVLAFCKHHVSWLLRIILPSCILHAD
jgi:hypothetical protein